MPTVASLLAQLEKDGDLFVVPAPNLERQTVPALLSRPGIAGVVLRSPDEQLLAQFPGRVATLDGCDGAPLPRGPASTLLCMVGRLYPTISVAKRLSARGVRNVAFCPAGADQFQVQPFTPARNFLTKVKNKVRAVLRIDRTDSTLTPPRGAANRDAEPFWRWSFEPLRRYVEQPVLAPQSFCSDEVVICISSLGSGGSERQASYTVAGLRKRGMKVSVALSYNNSPHEPYVRTIRESGVTPRKLPPFDPLSLPTCLLPIFSALSKRNCLADDNLLELMRYATLFSRVRPATVHAWLDWTNITAGLAALMVGVPRVVLSGRSVNPSKFLLHQPWMRPAYELALSSPRVRLLNNSAAGSRDYATWLGLDPAAIGVLRNALDFSEIKAPVPDEVSALRERLQLPAGAPAVCGIMRLSEEKRPDLFVRVAASVIGQRPDCHFVLAGEGPMRSDIERLAEELRLGGRMHFLGVTKNPGLVLALSDCLLLTSRAEGLPNVLIEAQALGVPVVASAVGGAPETFEEGVSGWAVPGDDPGRYAESILRILQDAPLARTARERGPALVRERFCMDRMIEETLAAYRL